MRAEGKETHSCLGMLCSQKQPLHSGYVHGVFAFRSTAPAKCDMPSINSFCRLLQKALERHFWRATHPMGNCFRLRWIIAHYWVLGDPTWVVSSGYLQFRWLKMGERSPSLNRYYKTDPSFLCFFLCAGRTAGQSKPGAVSRLFGEVLHVSGVRSSLSFSLDGAGC